MSVTRLCTSLARTLLTDLKVPHRYVGTYEMFERMYTRGVDPWSLQSSPFAQRRYRTLLNVLKEHTPCRSILDVGCGEGVFTQRLVGLGREVAGLDVSPTAVARASTRVPAASFSSGSLEEFQAEQRFDVVCAIEMLYYVPDVDAALDKLMQLGVTVIVSYTSREAARLDPHIDRLGDRAERQFYRFSSWTRSGFTVARLARDGRAQNDHARMAAGGCVACIQ